MAIETGVPRTRRALLAGGLGGLAALIAQALGRPLRARAADGDALILGAANSATGITSVYTSSDEGIAVLFQNHGVATALAAFGDQHGLVGVGMEVGVTGDGEAGGVGVAGRGRPGVLGYCGDGSLPPAPAKTGVYGHATQDSGARGVWGQSTSGRGVNGIASSGRGVHGQATSGQGVRGYATTGTAGYFQSQKTTAGYALRAIGRVKLDQCAGRATIAAGSNRVTVTPGIDLVSTSAVVATLQGSAGGTTTVHRCVVNTSANTFTIYLTKASTANVRVAYHVFG